MISYQNINVSLEQYFFKCMIFVHNHAIIESKIGKIGKLLSKYEHSSKQLFLNERFFSQHYTIISPKISKI